MITKERLLTGLIGTFIGLIFSKVMIYFLAATGEEDLWLVNHRLYATFLISLLFGLAAILLCSIKKQK